MRNICLRRIINQDRQSTQFLDYQVVNSNIDAERDYPFG
jgi:hypothetical protein